MKKTFKHLLASALLILPLLLQAGVGVQTVAAADDATKTADTVNITLHKLAFAKDTDIPDITNTGATLDKDALKGGTPEAGAEFTAYDVTEYYQLLLKSGKSAESASAILAAAIKKTNGGLPANKTEVGKETTAGAEGTATFKDLPVTEPDGTYATYVFLETKTPDTDSSAADTTTVAADPLVVTMPIYKVGSKSELNQDIHLYPKNQTNKTVTKDITAIKSGDTTEDVTDATPDVLGAKIGDTVSYAIDATVPSTKLATYTIGDTPDKGLAIIKDTIKVTSAGQDVPADYYTFVKNDKDGFSIKLTDMGLASMLGKTINVAYDATITKDATVNQALDNTVTVTPGGHTPVISHSPHTPEIGAITFTKVDASTNKALAGAEFNVTRTANDKTEYAVAGADGVVTWTDDQAKATTYKSDDAGLVAVTGLAYTADAQNKDSVEYVDGFSTYSIVETKAPEGYALLTKPTDFELTVGGTAGEALKGTDIKNAPEGILPHTGGMGIYIVIAAGLAVMIAGFVFLKKGNKREEI